MSETNLERVSIQSDPTGKFRSLFVGASYPVAGEPWRRSHNVVLSEKDMVGLIDMIRENGGDRPWEIRTITPPAGGHPGFLKVIDEMRALHIKKAQDYGTGADPFANIRASADLGIPAWKGAILRGFDKVQRIKAYVTNGKLANESIEDSLIDLAAYSIIALVLIREEKDNAGMAAKRVD